MDIPGFVNFLQAENAELAGTPMALGKKISGSEKIWNIQETRAHQTLKPLWNQRFRGVVKRCFFPNSPQFVSITSPTHKFPGIS